MKIHGFDSALPPPEKGKGQTRNSQVGDQRQIDNIELSSGSMRGRSYANRVSHPEELRNHDSRIEHPASHISRLRLIRYKNIAGGKRISDLESYPRAGQSALDRIETSPGAKPVEALPDTGRAAKIAEVQLKIAIGYYDNSVHIEALAEKLIERLNIGDRKGSDGVSRDHD